MNAAYLVDDLVHPVKYRISEGMFSGRNVIYIDTHRNDHHQVEDNGQNKLQHYFILLYALEFLRVYQRINQINTHQQNNASQDQHGAYLLSFLCLDLLAAPMHQQTDQCEADA